MLLIMTKGTMSMNISIIKESEVSKNIWKYRVNVVEIEDGCKLRILQNKVLLFDGVCENSVRWFNKFQDRGFSFKGVIPD